jgi:hypothetical protein
MKDESAGWLVASVVMGGFWLGVGVEFQISDLVFQIDKCVISGILWEVFSRDAGWG